MSFLTSGIPSKPTLLEPTDFNPVQGATTYIPNRGKYKIMVADAHKHFLQLSGRPRALPAYLDLIPSTSKLQDVPGGPETLVDKMELKYKAA